jgi:hypothetical protein
VSLDLAAPLRRAIVADAEITALLGSFNGDYSVHTRRPIPEAAGLPMIAISPDVSIRDQDGVRDSRPVIVRDIAVYGSAAEHYRVVEQIGYLIRDLFHRERYAIEVNQYNVIDIVADGPHPAPVDDASEVGRSVTLTIRLAKLI